MRIPFFNRKPEDLRKLSARATHIGSAEAAMPRLRPRPVEEIRAAGERSRRRRANGAPPS
jgi:hypothetical protein